MRAVLTLLWLAAALAPSHAQIQIQSLDFCGERYRLTYEDAGLAEEREPGNSVAEFTRDGESADDWTKLFAYHAYPDAGDDPTLATQTLANVVKEDNKDALITLKDDPEKGEAIIDFLTWVPGSDVMELNVFKYARASNGEGLVALQFAQRLKLADIDTIDFKALRAQAVAEMAATDIAPARAYFAARSKPRLGSHD